MINYKEENNHILLSICIPTYNRSQYLEMTLLSIINQTGFDNRCEIIVSDNNSQDNTEDIVYRFMNNYDNIRYHRNNENIGELNFISVMNLAKGKFIKLHNDNKEFKEGSLVKLLNIIDTFDCSVIFTLHTPYSRKPKLIECDTFDDFVREASCQSTWLAGIMLKNCLYKKLVNKERSVGTNLVQTDILFRVLQNDSRAIIINERLFYDYRPKYRTGYNFFNVHLNNYLSLYNEYLYNNLLSEKIFRQEKIKLLKMIIIPWYAKCIILHKYYNYDLTGANKSIINHYGKCIHLYLAPFYLLCSFFKRGNIKKLLETIS